MIKMDQNVKATLYWSILFKMLMDNLLQGGRLFHITVLSIGIGAVGSKISDKGLHCLTLIQQFLDISVGTLEPLYKTGLTIRQFQL